MQRQHHGGAGFDGPGSRPILGSEPGPSTVAKKSPTSSGAPSGRDRLVFGWTPEYAEPSPRHPPYPQDGRANYRQPHSPPRPRSHNQRPTSRSQLSDPYPPWAGSSGTSSSSRPPPPPLNTSSAAPSSGPPTSTTPVAPPVIKRVGGKANVSSACGPCKKAHLACDVARPCKRCVNMGKEDQCEDVPHKKRGRPKVNRTLAEPYQRQRIAPSDEGSGGKWKGLSGQEAGYHAMTTSPQQLQAGSALPTRLPSPPRTSSLGSLVRSNHSAASSMSPYSSSTPATATMRPPSQPPDEPLFTMFCTTDFKILRITSLCHALTGFYPHEFINLNFLEWVAPSDRQALDMERARLVAVPYLQQGQLQSSRDTHAAIMNQNERELLSPAIGMREPYPNQNARIQRADNGSSLFNVRLHLGGGLGGNLWHPETLGQVYLVVSCLLISPNELPPDPPRRGAPLPPTPVTPHPPSPTHALPSFSSIAAAADVPPRDRERERGPEYPYRSATGPPSAGPSATGSGAPPPPLAHGHPPPGPGGAHGPPPPGWPFRPGTAHPLPGSASGNYPAGPHPRRSPSPPFARPYTSYPPPRYGYPREVDRRADPRDRDIRGLRDPREVRNAHDHRNHHESRESRGPVDHRDMRDEHDRQREREQEPLRESDRGSGSHEEWRRSAPPGAGPVPGYLHRSPTEPMRHATYPPPLGAYADPHTHAHAPPHAPPHARQQPPHQHQRPHSPPPPPPQGAFRSWEL